MSLPSSTYRQSSTRPSRFLGSTGLIRSAARAGAGCSVWGAAALLRNATASTSPIRHPAHRPRRHGQSRHLPALHGLRRHPHTPRHHRHHLRPHQALQSYRHHRLTSPHPLPAPTALANTMGSATRLATSRCTWPPVPRCIARRSHQRCTRRLASSCSSRHKSAFIFRGPFIWPLSSTAAMITSTTVPGNPTACNFVTTTAWVPF